MFIIVNAYVILRLYKWKLFISTCLVLPELIEKAGFISSLPSKWRLFKIKWDF